MFMITCRCVVRYNAEMISDLVDLEDLVSSASWKIVCNFVLQTLFADVV